MFEVAVTFLGGQFSGRTPGMGSEWPPHPARVLYALVGAWFDGGEREDEVAALRWLEKQPAPLILAPRSAPEESYEAWVPMNSVPNWDKKGGKLPKLPKTECARSSRFVGDEPVSFVWPLDPTDESRSALVRLCRRCTRVGSSHSLAMLAVRERGAFVEKAWRPGGGGTLFRVPVEGVFDAVRAGKAVMPGRVLPCDWAAYDWREGPRPSRSTTVALTGRSWPVERTLELARGVRAALLAVAEGAGLAPRPVLHGYGEDGAALKRPHLAFCPRPHVGFRHASGAILGVSFILPVDATDEDRRHVQRVLARWFESGATVGLAAGETLRFGPADSRKTLTEARWGQASRVWQTVVPMELPRQVVKGRRWNAATWRRVDRAIRLACEHSGLPEPVEVEASWDPFAVGSPHVRACRGKTARPLMHTRLRFPVEVEGPLAIGAGRYFGLGLMEPVEPLR